MSCLWNPNFIAMMTYGVIAIPVSFYILITIVRKRKFFGGTFYRIYVFISLHEIIMYFIKYPIIRMPLFTRKSCTFAEFFEQQHFIGLEFIHFVHWHVGFTVLILESTIAFDRFVILLLDPKWKQLWKRYYGVMIIIAIVFPLLFSHVILISQSYYEYFENTDNYQIVYSESIRSYLYNGAIAMLLICTFISLTLNSIVLYSFLSKKFTIISNQKKTEFKLFIYSLIELVSEILMIIVFVLQRFTPLESTLYDFSRYFLVFTQDAVTLLPPFILLATSTQLREAILNRGQTQPTTGFSLSTKR